MKPNEFVGENILTRGTQHTPSSLTHTYPVGVRVSTQGELKGQLEVRACVMDGLFCLYTAALLLALSLFVLIWTMLNVTDSISVSINVVCR